MSVYCRGKCHKAVNGYKISGNLENFQVYAWPTKIHGHVCHILKAKIKRPVFRKLSVMNL